MKKPEKYKPEHDNTLKSFLDNGFEEVNEKSKHYPSFATPYNKHFRFFINELNDNYSLALLVNTETKEAIFRVNYTKTYKEPKKVEDSNIQSILGYGYTIKQIRFNIIL